MWVQFIRVAHVKVKQVNTGRELHTDLHIGAKKRGTSFPVPLKKYWNYSVSLIWSTAPAGPSAPCRGGPRLDIGFQIHNMLYLIVVICCNITKYTNAFPRFSHQNFVCGKVWETLFYTVLLRLFKAETSISWLSLWFRDSKIASLDQDLMAQE